MRALRIVGIVVLVVSRAGVAYETRNGRTAQAVLGIGFRVRVYWSTDS